MTANKRCIAAQKFVVEARIALKKALKEIPGETVREQNKRDMINSALRRLKGES